MWFKTELLHAKPPFSIHFLSPSVLTIEKKNATDSVKTRTFEYSKYVTSA